MRYKLKPEIKPEQSFVIFLIIMLLVSTSADLFSQSTTKPTRQSAMDAFAEGKYEVAYNQFNELLAAFPKDPLYKYYTGVSLIKLEKDPDKAATLLQQAIKGSSVVKALPSDAFLYLGKSQQMAGNFSDAIRAYNLYTEQVGKRTSKEDDVPRLIEQCKNKEGKLAVTAASIPAVIEKKPEPAPVNTNPVTAAVVVKEASEKALPPEYSKIMDEALAYQYKADSLNAIAGKKKSELDKLPVSEQAAAKSMISETLILAASFQTKADNKYSEADALMNGKRSSSDSVVAASELDSLNATVAETTTETPEVETNQISESQNQQATSEPVTAPAGIVAAGAATTGIIAAPGNTTSVSAATAVTAAVAAGSTGKVEIYKYFEILPKPVTDPGIKIPIDPESPAGLIYRIQIAAFRNPVAIAFFKGITPVYGFKSPSSGVTTYYAGLFRRWEDAKKAQAEVRAKGFKDAFVVSHSGGKTVSADRAAVLEKEWGKKPFAIIGDVSNESASDTVPPSLVFRVEAIRSLKPLKDEAVEELKKAAGGRGLDIQPLEDGNIVYLIGKFITFTSAVEYADLLIRNGYRDAKVVAWLGKREIPVETARQLFENP